MDADIFYNAYRAVYPIKGMESKDLLAPLSGNSEEDDIKLQYILTETSLANTMKQIEVSLKRIHKYDKSWVSSLVYHSEDFLTIKALWLFADGIDYNFYPRLQRMIIEHNNTSLTVSDYALFMYISYQDLETINMLKGVPLSMIKDMYQPIIDEKFNEWLKISLA